MTHPAVSSVCRIRDRSYSLRVVADSDATPSVFVGSSGFANVPFFERITARSIKFCSSRIFPGRGTSSAQKLFPDGHIRCAYPSGEKTCRQNASLGRECLRGAPSTAGPRSERRSDDNKGRCEILAAPPCPPNLDWSPPRAERQPGESEYCPGVRTPVHGERAAVWAAVSAEYRRPRRGIAALYRPLRNDRS